MRGRAGCVSGVRGAGDRVQCNSLPGQPTSPQGHCRCSRDSIHDPQLGTIFDFPYLHVDSVLRETELLNEAFETNRLNG